MANSLPVALLLGSFAALSGCEAIAASPLTPPDKYLALAAKPFPGTLRTIHQTHEEIQISCAGLLRDDPSDDYNGCAFAAYPSGQIDSSSFCTIFIIDPIFDRGHPREVNPIFWTLLYAHELAHCWGWPATHPMD